MVTDIEGNAIFFNDRLFRSGASMFLVVAGISIALLVLFLTLLIQFGPDG
jgi:hypothetical protein